MPCIGIERAKDKLRDLVAGKCGPIPIQGRDFLDSNAWSRGEMRFDGVNKIVVVVYVEDDEFDTYKDIFEGDKSLVQEFELKYMEIITQPELPETGKVQNPD